MEKKILLLLVFVVTVFAFKSKNKESIIWNGEYRSYDNPSFTAKGLISVVSRDDKVFSFTPYQFKKMEDTLIWAQHQYPDSKVGVRLDMGLLGRLSKRKTDLLEAQKENLESYMEMNKDSLVMIVVRKEKGKIIPL